MQEPSECPQRGSELGRRFWPWIVIALTVVPAVWHAVDFPDDVDPEFPRVVRPNFSRHPAPAYRLAEPGDTIDRIAIYMSAAAVVFSVAGMTLARGRPGLWPSALGAALGLFWYAANPGPTFDGWHGIGWRALADPTAPLWLRLALGTGALSLALFCIVPAVRTRKHWRELWSDGRKRGIAELVVAAVVLVFARQFEVPGVEPIGYWPRWALVWGLIAFDLALLKSLPRLGPLLGFRRLLVTAGGAGAWLALVVAGVWLTWYHRPLARLKTVVPDRIYISAMPTSSGLAIAHRRHHFKTIINLFPEDTAFRHQRLPEELKFARENGIRYLGSSPDVASSNGFLDRTLALAQDPNAWPILIHCHGCMDRSPAWMGIYRFVVQGRPLAEVMQEIERHRGYRPKASVTLLYNRVLPPRAPAHYAADPTAALLRQCAAGTKDPYEDDLRAEQARANLGTSARVSQKPEVRAR